MAKHFDASLGPFPERADTERFVPRAKPLRDLPEKEVALYAHLRDLPAHVTECPHASEAYRGEIRQVLLRLEESHPGTRHSILSGYEELAELAASQYRDDDGREFGECDRCGAPTARDVCLTSRSQVAPCPAGAGRRGAAKRSRPDGRRVRRPCRGSRGTVLAGRRSDGRTPV
jgi:uncharacterized protein (TIGR00269 family)